MNRFAWGLAFGFAFLLVPSQAPSQVVGKPSKAFFWKVVGSKATVYLLGSLHFAPPSTYPLPAEIETAFSSSSVLNVELDPTNVIAASGSTPTADQAAFQTQLMAAMSYPKGDVLWNHVDKETGHEIRAWCIRSNIPPLTFQTLKPWAVSLMITTLSAVLSGMDPQAGIDMHFLKEAADQHKNVGQVQGTSKAKAEQQKPVAPIETAMGQLKALASASDASQIADLKTGIKRVGDSNEEFRKLLNGWLTGDMSSELFNERSLGSDPKYVKALLYDRNLVMANFVDAELKAGTNAFVVVGAFHLIGEKGIVALLATRGYTVTQVPVTWTHLVQLVQPTAQGGQ